MKELLAECKKSDLDDLKYLFWHYFNDKKYQEAYFIFHYICFQNMDREFLTNSEVDILKANIE